MFKKSLLTLAFTGVATLSTYATAADTLTMEVYNPGEKACSRCLPKSSAANTKWR